MIPLAHELRAGRRDHHLAVSPKPLNWPLTADAAGSGTLSANLASHSVAHLRYDDDVQQFDRITMDPEVMGGKPCIRGMRVTAGMIVEAMAAGRTIEQLPADFPYIEEPDIREALGFAARLAQGHEIRLAS
jgi:uncharacterized protein (DUF433 family)